jgi:hypothetical protein
MGEIRDMLNGQQWAKDRDELRATVVELRRAIADLASAKHIETQILTTRPGDVLVLRSPERIAPEVMDWLKAAVERALARSGVTHPVGVMVVEGDIDIAVIRQEQS